MPTPLNNLPQLKARRRELRQRLTPAEATLWKSLQNSQLAQRKFRRQPSVGPYILDFYCPAERLVIELDGYLHFTESGTAHDQERDAFLNGLGIRVLRFENQLVFKALEGVLAEIERNFGWWN
jgi:very-short-patch-repair endonuclease